MYTDKQNIIAVQYWFHKKNIKFYTKYKNLKSFFGSEPFDK